MSCIVFRSTRDYFKDTASLLSEANRTQGNPRPSAGCSKIFPNTDQKGAKQELTLTALVTDSWVIELRWRFSTEPLPN